MGFLLVFTIRQNIDASIIPIRHKVCPYIICRQSLASVNSQLLSHSYCGRSLLLLLRRSLASAAANAPTPPHNGTIYHYTRYYLTPGVQVLYARRNRSRRSPMRGEHRGLSRDARATIHSWGALFWRKISWTTRGRFLNSQMAVRCFCRSRLSFYEKIINRPWGWSFILGVALPW